MAISPPDFAVMSPSKPTQLKITATFADGTKEDITPFCDFKITDDAIATVGALHRGPVEHCRWAPPLRWSELAASAGTAPERW